MTKFIMQRNEAVNSQKQKALISTTDIGSIQTYDYEGDCGTVDFFNPEAQEFVWNKCKKNYRDLGIDLFWLDNSEPDSTTYDFENYRYYTGRGSKVGCEYPKKYVRHSIRDRKLKMITMLLIFAVLLGWEVRNTELWYGQEIFSPTSNPSEIRWLQDRIWVLQAFPGGPQTSADL